MKALLGMLLLVNAALLMWNMGQREFIHGENAPDADFHPELINLLPAEKSRSMAKVTIESSGSVKTSNKLDDTGESTQMASAPADQVENGTETNEYAAEITTIADTAVSDTTVSDTTVSDTTVSDTTVLDTTDPIAEVETALLIEVKEGQCMYIGPYLTVLERGRAGRQLQDMKINFSENENLQGRQLGYRVYQGPFSTNEDVSRAKRRLERQGVEDLYLMNEEPSTKFISLGFFSNEKSANELMRQFSALQVVSKQRLEYARHYWLSVSDLNAIEKLKEKNAMPMPSGISKVIRDCEDQP